MNISEAISAMLLDMINRDGEAEIQRNELAGRFGCVPSQINYVITSRFTPEQGFLVSSRRGGGVYVRITRIGCDRQGVIMHLVNAIGAGIDEKTAKVNIQNLFAQNFISERDARLMLAAVSGNGFRAVPKEEADAVRAGVLKQMLLAL